MQDDNNYEDDFEDDFDSLDDFDDGLEFDDEFSELDDSSTIDEGGDDSGEFDEIAYDDIDESQVSNKESLFSRLSFNQIVIGATVIVGAGIFAFQLLTAEPPPREERFQSSVSMTGSSDNMVFGENQAQPTPTQNDNVAKNQVQEMTANTEALNSQGGILNNPESLDSLEINFDDEPPMPMPIASNDPVEEQNAPDGEDALLLKKFDAQGVVIDQANNDVVVSNEFLTPQSEIGVTDQAEDLPAFDNALNQGTTITRAEPFLKSAQNQMADTTAPITTPIIDVVDEEAIEPIKMDMKPDEASPMEAEVATSSENIAEKEIKTTKDAGQLSEQDQESVTNELVLAKEKEIAALKETVASLKKEVARLKSPPKKATVKKKTAPKKAVTRSKSTSSEWELRAAQPGKAWVSQKGRNELQPIIVGDTLSGMGKIKSIEYVGNQWIVTGTQGSIKQ